MKTKVLLVGGGILLAGALFLPTFLKDRLANYRVELMDEPRPERVLRLDQNWTDEQREAYYFTPQGTVLLPTAWFKALEQPCFSPFGCGAFADPDYMRGFGFIVEEDSPHGLPVGFAVDEDFVDPATGRQQSVVGLTCSACHTGELFHDEVAVRIDGGPAMVDVGTFQKALGLALGFNVTFPLSVGRYGRFEEAVLGDDATEEQKAQLRASVEGFVEGAKTQIALAEKMHLYDVPAGFMRTDALARIGNQVFGYAMEIPDNYVPADAPVRFPQIWDASWFNWVQYNSSISDPLARNIGEALGVRAAVTLAGDDSAKLYANSVNLPGLRKLEGLLAGDTPFDGLASPKWPAELPALDGEKVTAGAALYASHCQHCHLPEREVLMEDLRLASEDAEHTPRYWWRSGEQAWYLKVTDVDIKMVGTDPRQAVAFRDRKADSGALGEGVIAATVGLDVVTEGIAKRYFQEASVSAEDQILWRGGRDPEDPRERVRAPLVYKARPLNGVWAVGPYLHNGSVPTLDALLSPNEEDRPAEFWMGSKRFDPVKVGYSGEPVKGATRFDVTEPGNLNSGHWFRDGPRGNGVIGPALSDVERGQIIEYLKSL